MFIKEVITKPFDDQKPGTSGLRKKVRVFQQKHYAENFIQSIFDTIETLDQGTGLLVIGGDGRFLNEEVMRKIISIGAGNGVAKFIVGQNGIMSTPAASCIIRKYQEKLARQSEDSQTKLKLIGGIILTASHNPGGEDNDFGIKYNLENGAPAPETITEKIFEATKSIKRYSVAHMNSLSDSPIGNNIEFSTIGTQEYGNVLVEVVDSVKIYSDFLKTIFDFDCIRRFRSSFKDFSFAFDALNGVTGPYAKQIFCEELRFPIESLRNCHPKPDFGGMHPDPNLIYAKTLVDFVEAEKIDFGAASDGDGDRNMIYGHNCFVSPGDSVAIIAQHAEHCIPWFSTGLKGLARSMPTSKALDLVAEKLKVSIYEVPTGWKFFCNLFDANRLSICGEESFGQGSDHIREKDGLWAVVAWLNICAKLSEERKVKVTLQDLLMELWKEHGRVYFARYDYENLELEQGKKVMENLKELIDSDSEGKVVEGMQIKSAGEFNYVDPIDKSESNAQGLFVRFKDGERITARLSGTGSSGATVRLYLEKHVKASSNDDGNNKQYQQDVKEVLRPIQKFAMSVLKIKEVCGREEPDVVT